VTFLILLISNSVQLFSFIVAQVINYTTHTRLKLVMWIVIQFLFFMLLPIWILVFGLVNGNGLEFTTYWIVIDCFLTLTIFLRYFKNYSSAFLKVVATDEKQARRPQTKSKARIIVEGANIVRFEESIYSLAIALTRHEKRLNKIIMNKAKKEKISFGDRDKPISSFEVAEVFGTLDVAL